MAVKQTALMVAVPVLADQQQALLEALASGEAKILAAFQQSPSTHFARLVVIENSRLLFSSNFDGELEPYLRELASSVGPALEPILIHCQGYTEGTAGNFSRLSSFVSEYSIPVYTFYVALPEATVQDITVSASERLVYNDELTQDQGTPPLTGPLPPTPAPAPSGSTSVVATDLGNVLQWIVGIRQGTQDENANIQTSSILAEIEDIYVQNQMTVIVPVKKSPLSRLILKIVLWAVNRAAQGARGSLSGITTIHFARWTVIDGGDNLLFESNYDGSWESYIDDFVDSASLGMNLIWGNCVGFPLGGSKDVEAFKAYIRANQIPSQVFYSAYPDLTMRNILTDLAMSGRVSIYAKPNSKSLFKQGIYVGGGSQ